MLHFRSLLFFLRLLGDTVASRAAAPLCYDDDGQFPPPAALDCLNTMGNIRKDPYYSTPQRFGAYEDPPRKIPIDWAHKSCLVTIDVDDNSYTGTFALSSTMPAFAQIEEHCIIERKLGQGFGGYVPVGHGKTFYAIVQYNRSYRLSGLREDLLGFLNRTDNATTLTGLRSSESSDAS